MKKLSFVLGFVALMAFTTTSCKKDYTCTCTSEIPGMDPVTASTEMTDVKKKDAEDACEKLNDAGGSVTTCELE